MRYFATTICPKCGKKEVQMLNNNSFLGKEETTCTKCGQRFSTVFNCLVKTHKEDEALAKAGYKKIFAKRRFAKQNA